MSRPSAQSAFPSDSRSAPPPHPHTLPAQELKSFLYDREGSLSGAKKVLVDRVTEVLVAEGQIGGGAPAPAPAAAATAAAAAPPPAEANGFASPAPLNGAAPTNGVAQGGGDQNDADDDDDEDMPKLGLFDTNGSSSDPQDDFLIDEVFSAM